MSVKKKIALLIYSNPDHYPPTLNAVTILSRDFDVMIVSRNYEKCWVRYPQGVRVHRLGKPCTEAQKDQENPAKKILEFVTFIVLSCWYIRKNKCGFIYAYDMHAFLAGLAASICGRRIPFIYHNHDLIEKTKSATLNNVINWLQFRLSWCADRVVFPDVHRARYFKEKARLSYMPEVVMNTPLRLAQLPQGRLRQVLDSRGIGADYKIVVYQGGIDKWRSIPEVIQSIRFWPDKTVLVLAGIVYDEEQRQGLFSAIGACSQEKKIVYIGYVAHDELFGYLSGADLGLAFYKPATPIKALYGGGGSNKIFEYLALGIPVVTTDSEYFREIMSEDFLYFADPYSPEEIGTAIYKALSDDTGRAAKARAARRAHSDTYHYEKQFAPIFDYITKNCLP